MAVRLLHVLLCWVAVCCVAAVLLVVLGATVLGGVITFFGYRSQRLHPTIENGALFILVWTSARGIHDKYRHDGVDVLT